MIMSKVEYLADEDFKIPGNWERFLKRFQEKFWKEMNATSQSNNSKENQQFTKAKN